MAKIVLDPGHGGTTKIGGSSPNNAIGPTGLLEKTVTLDLAQRAEALLKAKGHTVTLTRKTDKNLGLADRAKVAKSSAAPVFLSIHLNGLDGKVQGTETICHLTHNSLSADLCRAVQKRVVAATGHKDRNAGHPGGVKRQALGVLKPSLHHVQTGCCLLEVSFMDVPAEEARLKTQAYLNKIAKAIADGIVDHVGAGGTVSAMKGMKGVQEFEDGFSAEGGKGSLPSSVKGMAGKKSPAKKKKAAKAAKKSAKKAAAAKPDKAPAAAKLAKGPATGMNDVHEFSTVEIGAGFDPDAPGLGMAKSGLGLTSFNMEAFRAFVDTLDLRHFTADELLFMGGSNQPGGACAGRNNPPPQTLWPRIANTAKMLDEIRQRLNAKCTILSAYRSLAYNGCVGGEPGSLHMQYNAIDFRCVSGSPTQWRAIARDVRASASRFTGGIGIYSSFVHIDTRGSIANWEG